MKQAVIFDMDGTIFDSEILVIETWEEIGKKYGLKNIREICMQCLGCNAIITKGKFKDFYGQDFPYDEYKKEMSALYHQRVDEGQLRLKPGVMELLDYLKSMQLDENGGRTYVLAVASSTREAVIRKELALAGILDRFEVIVAGDKVERSKPEPDIFLLTAEKLGVEPSHCVVLEDSYNGIRAAYRAGMHPIMIPDLIPADEEMMELAEYVFPSLHEVKKLLQESLQK